MNSRYFFLLIALVICILPVQAKQSNNLSESVKTITAGEGKQVIDRQLVGSDNTSLGLKLPNGITRDELSNLVFGRNLSEVKKINGSAFQGLAAREWPGRVGVYIGVGGIRKSDKNDIDHAQVYACAFKILAPHKFQILASAKSPLQFDCRVEHAQFDSLEIDGGLDELVRIDPSVFKIAPANYAIGLRLGHNVGYGGGFGYQENLILLMQKDNTLVPIFNHLVYAMHDLAGDWNPDHTRQRETQEKKFIAIVEPNTYGGCYPIRLKETRRGKLNTQYIWDSSKGTYR